MNDRTSTELLLSASDFDDIKVLSSLTQDAILLIENIKWLKKRHRFTLLLDRFKWEMEKNDREDKGFKSERCLSTLIFDNVLKVSYKGLENALEKRILSLLTINIEEIKKNDDTIIYLIFSGNIVIKLRVEIVQAFLKDIVGTSRLSLKVSPDHKMVE